MTCRVANGSAVAAASTDLTAIHTNNYYFSKDPLYTEHSSYVVHKGSPLQVVMDSGSCFAASWKYFSILGKVETVNNVA